MTREEFIKHLDTNDIPYSEYTENGLDMVYVFSKNEYEMKKAHPRKHRDLHVPYLRVSHFNEDRWYARENGYCCYMSEEEVLNIVDRLGA